MAQRSVLTQLNGSPKTSVNTAVNTVLTHAPGKTRVYLQKTGYTREIPGSASMPRAPYSYSQGPCANCGGTDLSAQYAHWTMYCPRVEEGGRDAAPACLLPRRRRCRHPAVELTRTSSQTANCDKSWLRGLSGIITRIARWHLTRSIVQWCRSISFR